MSALNLPGYLERCRKAVEAEFERHFTKKADAPRLVEAMKYSLEAGGKRVRPALCIAACEAVGGDLHQALPAACALEMVHTYSLIHDDLPAMDDDDLRRGRPTNHKVFGDALAILAGDALLTEAFGVLSDPAWKIPADRKIDIVGILAEGAGSYGMVAGQALDLEWEGKDFDEVTLEKIHRNKTGMLLRASVLAGGRAGGASGDSLKALEGYGRAIGLAFQIADDVLDLTATTEELGKDSKSDLKKKKATYPALVGIDEARRRAQALLETALSALKPFEGKGEALALLARFIVDRRS